MEGGAPKDGFTKPSYKDLDLGELMLLHLRTSVEYRNFFHDNWKGFVEACGLDHWKGGCTSFFWGLPFGWF
jgi:hypothetical protein